MDEVKWIKVSTSMFEKSRKIKNIELMKDGDRIIVIWFKLLLLAGNINDGGAIYITVDKPYDLVSLAGELRRPAPLVKRALDIFEEYGMIEIEDGIIYLTSWDKYQSADKLEIIREQNRVRKRRQRERQSDSVSRDGHVTCHADVTDGHATEEEEDGDTDISFIHSIAREEDEKESLKRKYLGGTLGGGVVMLSDEQFDSLCEQLSNEELEKYLSVVRDCERNGQHYKKKTHYQAILDMAYKDRKVKKG